MRTDMVPREAISGSRQREKDPRPGGGRGGWVQREKDPVAREKSLLQAWGGLGAMGVRDGWVQREKGPVLAGAGAEWVYGV
jgi:hypothetical protein